MTLTSGDLFLMSGAIVSKIAFRRPVFLSGVSLSNQLSYHSVAPSPVHADPRRRKITFVVRRYLPNPNINGESVCKLVTFLEKRYVFESKVVCIDRTHENAADLAAGIRWLLDHPTPGALSDAARRFALTHYAPDAVARRHLSLYQELLAD